MWSERDWGAAKERATGNVGRIAHEMGLSHREVRRRIEWTKQSDETLGGAAGNPDVSVDPDTGEVFPQTNDGTLGDSIGNLRDALL